MFEGRALIKACGKLELLASMLRILQRDGHRVLIFSQVSYNHLMISIFQYTGCSMCETYHVMFADDQDVGYSGRFLGE